jgi:hypothetical protein
MIEGAANGAAVTAAEGTLASPEPASKLVVFSGIGALVVGDIAFTTKVQMQLLLEIGEIYDCPFSHDDEDDVWIVLKAAFGIRGTERAAAYGRATRRSKQFSPSIVQSAAAERKHWMYLRFFSEEDCTLSLNGSGKRCPRCIESSSNAAWTVLPAS